MNLTTDEKTTGRAYEPMSWHSQTRVAIRGNDQCSRQVNRHQNVVIPVRVEPGSSNVVNHADPLYQRRCQSIGGGGFLARTLPRSYSSVDCADITSDLPSAPAVCSCVSG